MQLLHIKNLELRDEVDCSSDNYVTSATKLAVQVVKYNQVIWKVNPIWASARIFSFITHPQLECIWKNLRWSDHQVLEMEED